MSHLYDPAISNDFCPLVFRQSLFRVLDEDGSGDIAYTEFVEQVVKMSALAEPNLAPAGSSPSGMTEVFFRIFWVGLFGAIKLGRWGVATFKSSKSKKNVLCSGN